MEWVKGKIDTDAFMLWLYGPAGAGKTAIARTIAELCAKGGLLLASFLFFRSDAKRNTMLPLVPTIAYRVACDIPGARELINTVIEADPLILSSSLEAQFTKLLLEPLRLLADRGYRHFPKLIIIDGLDECLDKDAQINLIRLLSSSEVRCQLPLKFLIASRPEPHIKLAVSLAGQPSTISHLQLNNDFVPDQDIRRFLTDKFHEIKTYHPFCQRIPPLWPSKQQIDTLICKASGQFIYASLAMRFIKSVCNSPIQQLDIVLGPQPSINRDLPFAELDTFYTFILSETKNLDLVLSILGVNDCLRVTKHAPCAVELVEHVLGLEKGNVNVYLSPLSSLLGVQRIGLNDTIVIHHSSFMDFLHTPERSTHYCISPPKNHNLIAQWMLQIFSRNGIYSQASFSSVFMLY